MYVTLIIIFSVLLWAITGFSLPDNKNKTTKVPADSIQRRMELREEMHRRMMQQLFSDKAPDEDLFKDMEQMFNDSMAEAFTQLQQLDQLTSQENFKLEWLEDSTGRTMAITPQSPEQKLDINVQKGVIIIKGQREQKSAQGSSFTNFTNSFPVPDDCDGSKVKMEQQGEKILIKLPYRTTVKDERRPIPASEEDVTI